MAREESSREDLLGEATALVERIELLPRESTTESFSPLIPGTPIVAGFRSTGNLSCFFGEDPVYQFNTAGELRRAYRRGRLLKAERGKLAALTRERSSEKTELVRHDLTEAEQADAVDDMQRHLRALARLLDSRQYHITGQEPTGVDIIGRLRTWLAEHDGLPVAARPNVIAPNLKTPSPSG